MADKKTQKKTFPKSMTLIHTSRLIMRKTSKIEKHTHTHTFRTKHQQQQQTIHSKNEKVTEVKKYSH